MSRLSSSVLLPDHLAGHALALLSLLTGQMPEQYQRILREHGFPEPDEIIWNELARTGLVTRGPFSGARILTPQGRRTAGNIAAMLASATGAHVPRVGIRDKAAYFRCTCGADIVVPLSERGSYSRCRNAYDLHREMICRAVEGAKHNGGTPADHEALLSERLRAWHQQVGRNRERVNA